MAKNKLNRVYASFLESKEYSTKSLLKGVNGSMINSNKGENLKLGQFGILLSKSEKSIKKNYSDSGMLYDIYNTKYNSEVEYWIGIDDLSQILLSDNVPLFQELNKRKNYKLGEEKGGWCGMQYAMLQIASSDWHGLKETINYLKTVKEPYDKLFHDIKVYFKLYQGFIDKDKDAVERCLNTLESEDYRKYRQSVITLEKDISIITLALGRLACMHGMDVEINSKYVPKKLLQFKPLEEYTIPYKFLRDFYREQGVNWRYDPVYPKLQDWDNDPENPKRKKKGFLKRLFS